MKWIVGSTIHGCWLGTFEYEKQRLFSGMVGPNSVIFDVGGNVGFYTLLASVLTGRDGKVYVFEPLPGNLFFLRKHLQLNRINNVTVVEAAVSNLDGPVHFDEGPRGEMAHISEAGRLRVNSLTLDSLYERGEIPAPDFIKMDIEGAEFNALTGARQLLMETHPAIFLATHGHKVHTDCCGFLDAMGYKLKSIDKPDLHNSSEILAIFSSS
jgi:FkbM family methyltransferase